MSWTEYWQALSELSLVFRRHGISTKNSGDRAATPPVGTSRVAFGSRSRAGGCFSPNVPLLADNGYRDSWEGMFGRTTSCASPLQHRGSGSHNEEACPRGDVVAGCCPPRSPGADSFGVLRRKRQAAVSLDYEGITKQLPQVGSADVWLHAP